MKPVVFVGSSHKDLKKLPEAVQRQIGFAIFMAQNQDRSLKAVPLVGYHGSQVLEVVVSDEGNAYRAVYTVRLEHAVYVLHVFQKKSKRGISTPKQEMELVRTRLKTACKHHDENFGDVDWKDAQNDQIS